MPTKLFSNIFYKMIDKMTTKETGNKIYNENGDNSEGIGIFRYFSVFSVFFIGRYFSVFFGMYDWSVFFGIFRDL